MVASVSFSLLRARPDLIEALDLPAVAMTVAAIIAFMQPTGTSRRARAVRAVAFLILAAAIVSSVLVPFDVVAHSDFGKVFMVTGVHPVAEQAPLVAIPLAFSYCLLSVALLLRLRSDLTRSDLPDFLAAIASITTILILIGGVETGFVYVGGSAPRILLTSLTLLLLAAGVFLSRRRGAINAVEAGRPITARLMRPLLVMAAVTPVATDHFARLGSTFGIYTQETEAALDTVSCTAVLLVMAFVIARTVARAESGREEALNHLRLQFDCMPVACITRDTDFRVQSWNPAAEAMFGYSESEMIGGDADALIPPERRVDIECRRQRILAGNRTDGVGELFTKDRRRIVCRWVTTPLYKDGKIVSFLTTAEDVTARQLAKEELRKSEERYRGLVEYAPYGILVRSGEEIVYANAAAAEQLRAEPQSLVGRSVLELVHPDDLPVVQERIRESDQNHQPTHLRESRWVRADGVAIEVEVFAAPITWGGNVCTHVMFRDVTDRNAARRQLRLSEERYRRVIESTNEGVLILDPDGGIEFANEQICRMIERPQAEMLHQPATSTLAAEDSLPILETHLRRRREGLADRYEVTLTRKSGEKFDALISGAPLLTDARFTGSVAVVSDISESKTAERKLRESEERYRDLLDSMPNLIFSVDLSGRYIAANRVFCESFGRPGSEIIGRTSEELGVSPEIAAEWHAARMRVLETGVTESRETTLPLPDGELMRARATLAPLRDAQGKIVAITGIGIDITEQKAAEEAVQRLLHGVEQIDEVIFTTDVDGRITYVNPAFEKVYGYSREEALGRTPRLLKSGEIPPERYESFWNELLSGRSVREEYVNRTRSGAPVRVVGSAAPILDSAGNITGFVAVQRDVTAERIAAEERQRLDERLGQLAKMESLGTLAGGIAHDFNNILAIVTTHASILERRRNDDAGFATALTTLKQAVKRGASVSRQILTFARRTDVKLERVNISSMLIELGSMLSETFPRSIDISLDFEQDLPTITADAGQLHQALLNLCVNARDAMPSGGTLTIAARRTAKSAMAAMFPDAPVTDHLCLVVADNGIGMDQQTRSRIFEPFFTTKPKGKGTGLGLALVYGIVNSHNAVIDLRSEPGKGTEFRLYFPLLPPVATTAERGAAGRPADGTETILLVDDEAPILQAAAESLRDLGYRVIPARNAAEAIDFCERYSGALDAIVTDLGLPGMSTADFLRAMRGTAPNLPIIAMTGYVDLVGHASVAAVGVAAVIQKPFEIEELAERLREVLDSAVNAGERTA